MDRKTPYSKTFKCVPICRPSLYAIWNVYNEGFISQMFLLSLPRRSSHVVDSGSRCVSRGFLLSHFVSHLRRTNCFLLSRLNASPIHRRSRCRNVCSESEWLRAVIAHARSPVSHSGHTCQITLLHWLKTAPFLDRSKKLLSLANTLGLRSSP